LSRLRDELLDLLADLEAGFDFADEDLPFITPQQLAARLAAASSAVRQVADQLALRGEAADAVRAVLTGSPNPGKSSLFNAISGSAGALVSSHPGTTRDYLTAELDLDGVGCQLIDTAGVDLGTDLDEPTLDEALGSVDDTARAVASRQTRQAHLRIFCLDSTRRMKPSEREELAGPVAGQRVVVLTKVDLPRRTDLQEQAIATSSLTGQGINELRDALRDAVLAAGAEGADVVTGTAVRCRESLRLAADALRQAEAIVRAGDGEELVAAEIRVALTELGRVVGAVYTDDLLDRIFTRFCIGK